MSRQLAIPVLALAFAFAAFAGCGGDDSSSASGESSSAPPEPITTSSLSKAAFLKKVNSICADYRDKRGDEISAYVEENRSGDEKPSDDSLIEAINTVFVPSLNAQVEEIRDLGAPEGDDAKVEKFLVGFEKAADAAAELKSIKAKAPLDRAFSNAGVAAGKYGLKECAVG